MNKCSNKKCFVPNCQSNWRDHPNKVFLTVRDCLKRDWCHTLGISYHPKHHYFCCEDHLNRGWCHTLGISYHPKHQYFCCEDHLNLEEDLENYYYWKLMNGRPVLKPTATLKLNTAEVKSVDMKEVKEEIIEDCEPLEDLETKPVIELLDVSTEETSVNADPLALTTELTTVKAKDLRNQSCILITGKPQMIPTTTLVNTPREGFTTELTSADTAAGWLKPETPVVYKPDDTVPTTSKKLYMLTKIINSTQRFKSTQILNSTNSTHKLDSTTHKHNSSSRPFKGNRDVGTQYRVATREACVGYNGRKTVPIGFRKPKPSLDVGTEVKVLDVREPCSCCLFRPSDKYLKTSYTDDERTEIYSDMFEECFNIQIATEGECGICGECVRRLRDARDFKLQVQRSQARLRARAENPGQDTDMYGMLTLEMSIETDGSRDDVIDAPSKAMKEEPIALPAIIMRNDGLYECDACHKTFKREASSKSHILVHYQQVTQGSDNDTIDEDGENYSCDECGAEFIEKTSYDNHVKTHDELYKPQPSEQTDTQENMSDNNSSDESSAESPEDSGSEEYACHLCDKVLTQKRSYISHLKKHESPLKCDICPKEFLYESSLAKHKSIHAGLMYICDMCKKKFYDKTRLTEHIQLHMNVKPFSCKVCNKAFKSKYYLKTHKLYHIKEKNYSCGVCDKRFGHDILLQRHEQLHKSELCVCEQCGKQFSKIYLLGQHRRFHTGDKRYECNICMKRYYTNKDLNVHHRSHTGLKPYQCDLCPKKYKTASYLTIHKRMHRGEKPYPCDMCDKRFLQYRQMRLHKLVHTGERPHSCGVCGKKFSRKEHLNRHLLTHKERKYYSCEKCPKVYSNKDGFQTHLRNHAKGLI